MAMVHISEILKSLHFRGLIRTSTIVRPNNEPEEDEDEDDEDEEV